MTEETRSLEMEVVAAGTPAAVWRAIATGPGISSWYVPHTIDEQAGGSAVARFGPGPDMEVPGRVVDWDPPRRVVFDGGEDVGGFAFEWTVEPATDSTCRVRLVNHGFPAGPDGDAMYEAMTAGWRMFLFNLQLHCTHFAGQSATSALPTVSWEGDKTEVWNALTSALGVSASPAVGDHVELVAGDDLRLAGEVVDALPTRFSLVVDQPVPGTALVAVEGADSPFSVSVWSYLYGDEGRAAVERDELRWQAWLDAQAAAS